MYEMTVCVCVQVCAANYCNKQQITSTVWTGKSVSYKNTVKRST